MDGMQAVLANCRRQASLMIVETPAQVRSTPQRPYFGRQPCRTSNVQHRGLLPEDPLRVVAQLLNLTGIQQETAVLGGLPCPRSEQLVDHALVDALRLRNALPGSLSFLAEEKLFDCTQARPHYQK